MKNTEKTKTKIELGPDKSLTFQDFYEIVIGGKKNVKLSAGSIKKLDETIDFVHNFLLKNKLKVYGVTTGFADLKNKCVPISKSSELSHNIIESHDAGIGKPLPDNVVLGAMLLRANALSKGFSGFQVKNLNVLIQMINKKIIPLIPEHGSLGASGDLAYLARLGRAMEGQKNVKVKYKGQTTTAYEAFLNESIKPCEFGPKEGLALTNGTSFLTSAAVLGFIGEVHNIENSLSIMGLFLNAYKVVDAAFYECIQQVRKHKGQLKIAKIIQKHFVGSNMIDVKSIQDDYLIRCIPQIFGYLMEILPTSYKILEDEMNAVTDNPLIYRGKEITKDVHKNRIFVYNDKKWAIISGGNFHGEYIAQLCDNLTRTNVKIAYVLERHLTFMLNPDRHKQKDLGGYLITDKKNMGLLSGFMITQYTGNSIVQKIAFKGLPTSIFNITSANESEDIVSYGATSAAKLLEQCKLFRHLNCIYLIQALQAYSIVRTHEKKISKDLLAEKIYMLFQKKISLPIKKDVSFEKIYMVLHEVLDTSIFRKIVEFPLFGENLPKETCLNKVLL